MSLRPAPWPLFGNGNARRAGEPGAPSKPDLRLVKGGGAPRLERLSPRARLVSLVAMVGIVLFAVVAFHVVLSQGQFQLEKLEAKADDEQDRYSRLRLQVAELESPARITTEARDRLGMVPPKNVTPVAPKAGDMPNAPVSHSGTASPPTTRDIGDWGSVKPHLASTTK